MKDPLIQNQAIQELGYSPKCNLKKKNLTNFCGLPEIITTEKHSCRKRREICRQLKEIFYEELQEWSQLLPAAFKADEFSTLTRMITSQLLWMMVFQ